MSWIFYSILAPALYGASAFVDRFLVEKKVNDYLFLTSLSGLASLIFAAAIMLVRGFPAINPSSALALVFSGMLYEIALLPYYYAIALDDASRVTPLFQVIPVFILVMSYVFLHEVPTQTQLAGFFLILGGALILSVEGFSARLFRVNKFFWFVMLSALLYAVPGIIFKFITAQDNFWDSLFYEFIGGTIGAVLLVAWRYCRSGEFMTGMAGMGKDIWSIIFLNELIYIAARFLTFYSIILAPIYLVSVLGSIGPVFVFLYGIILSVWFPQIIKEDLSRQTLVKKIIAILIIVAGASLINSGSGF